MAIGKWQGVVWSIEMTAVLRSWSDLTTAKL